MAGGASSAGNGVNDRALDMESSRKLLVQILWTCAVVALAALTKVALVVPRHIQVSLAANVGLSATGFALTTSAIESLGPSFVKAGLRGIDLNKVTTLRDCDGNLVRPINGIAIPESQGTVSGMVYVLVMSVFIPFAFVCFDRQTFPHAQLAEYLAALLTVAFGMTMGIVDDIIDLRWRHKIPLPFLATLPLLLVYHASGKQTGVMVPLMLRNFLGEYVELGLLFYVFLLVFAVFSTHAINIYAGVNGLEVGQAVVVAVSALILNVVQLNRIPSQFHEYREQHLQSLFLLLPFISVSLALLRLNWFPSRVFVGDTYCYFAGMTFAVTGIVGHYSKTMCLFLIPQFLNFVYSCPQLFSIIGVPIPRHRMPTFDPKTGCVGNSFTEFKPESLPTLGKVVFGVLRTLRLANIQPPDSTGTVRMSNLTLINFVLFVGGPCREDVLCLRLLVLQIACSLLCFSIRFGLASYMFEVVG
eukprot:TRINITY_DN73594_c0_g1_i1.p1 TRINITY_DN73594_c0_g1~~TRINITY_DN73594_c0_g1_i1.p1  ORF type:complete len:472 (-),score=54.25 TRINITY_DN73594_c0_g1_i1:148-1563(-)